MADWVAKECILKTFLGLLILCFHRTFSYNVDLYSPVMVYKGPAGSYIGFSMTVHRISGSAWLITGAPRANSEFQPSLERPGAIFKCSLDIAAELYQGKTNLQCDQLPLDRKGNTDVNELKDKQWMGVSVSSFAKIGEFSILVACGHLWRYEHLRSGVYKIDAVNGACYIKRGHPDTGVTYVNREKYYDMVIQHNGTQSVGKGAGRLSGMATHVAKDGIIYSGLPGVGMKVDLTANGGINKYDPRKNTSCDLADVTFSVSYLSYLGFSITTGNTLASNKNSYNIIAGAPLSDNVGEVLIFSEKDCKATLLQRIRGDQLKAYFGGSILVTDVDGDGWDDLFIGAPFYKTNMGDEGIVKVYYGGQPDTLVEGITLSSNIPGSRFGTTLSAVGDLDEDGYKDIIIGAPYEDNGRGAVYVYNGSPEGISANFTQRIRGGDLPQSPMGLGYGITGGFDVDRNGYRDIAIGAYDSGHVYVIRTRPVLNILVDTLLQEKCITPEEHMCRTRSGNQVPCFTFNVTLKWDSIKPESLSDSHAINWAIEMDQYEALNHRALFLVSDSSVRKRSGREVLSRNSLSTHTFMMQIPRRPNDRIRPIVLKIEYALDHPNVTYDSNPNKLPPIVNHTIAGTIESKIEFCKDCSGDLTCKTDLKLTLTPSADFYVIGQPWENALTLRVDITNDGDGAYNSQLDLLFPFGSTVSVEADTGDHSCVRSNVAEEHPGMEAFFCPTGNPMRPNSTRWFVFSLINSVTDESLSLPFDVRVHTLTAETPEQMLNNNASLLMPVRFDAQLLAKGSSAPEKLVTLISETQQSEDVRHVLDIRNNGPGLVTNFTVNFDVPLVNRDDITVIPKDFEISYEGGKTGALAGCVSPEIENVTVTESETDIGRALSKLFGSSGVIELDPNTISSAITNCTVEGLEPNERVIITYKLEIIVNNDKAEGLFSSGKEYDFITRVSLPEYFGRRSCGQCNQVEIRTAILPPSAEYTIPWWIILVSVLGGLILVIILIVVLYRCGFFRRKQHQVVRRERKSMRAKSMYLDQNADDDDDDDDDATLKLDSSHGDPQTPEEEKAAMEQYVKDNLHTY